MNIVPFVVFINTRSLSFPKIIVTKLLYPRLLSYIKDLIRFHSDKIFVN